MGKFNTHGGYFAPKDYFRINAGGSHEENPNGGVQIGHDQNGVPNLLEENEPVYKDFVYSDNIKANKSILKEFNIPEKYAGKLYSEIADSFIEEAEERPMDPISNSGLREMLGRLADAQEEQKFRKEEAELQAEISKLSPEELAVIGSMMGQQQMTQSPEMQYNPMQEQMMQQQIMPQGQTTMVPEAGMMMAYGGPIPDANIFRGGSGGTNWEKVAGVATGALGGAGVGALQGFGMAGIPGAIGMGVLGGISGGSMASNLYDQNYAGAAIALLGFGAGKGITSGVSRAVMGKATKVATLSQVEKAAHTAAARAAKATARQDAVKVAEDAVTAAVDNVATNSKALNAARETIVKLVDKQGLSKAEVKALKDARVAYREAADKVPGLDKALNTAEKDLRKANVKAFFPKVGNAIKTGAKAVNTGRQWVWDKAGKYVFDPSATASNPWYVHVPQALGALGVDASIPIWAAQTDGGGSKIDYNYTIPAASEDQPTFSNPFKAAGGIVNRFDLAGNMYRDGYTYFPTTGQPIGVQYPYKFPQTSAGIRYLPYNNADGFMYYNNGVYDNGYLEWLNGQKFNNPTVFDELADYYKRTTGRTLTPELAVRLGQDKKFGRFHDILGQAYTDYLNSNVGTTTSASPTTSMAESNVVRSTNTGTPQSVAVTTSRNVTVPRILTPEELVADETDEAIARKDADPYYYGSDSIALRNIEEQILRDKYAESVAQQAAPNPSGDTNPAVAPVYSTLPRYAGIANNLLAAAYNLAQPADYYDNPSIDVYRAEGRMPLQMQAYMPMDMSVPVGMVRAQGNAAARAINNAGIGPSTSQALLANGFNTSNAIGNTLLQDWQANNQQRNVVIGANNAAQAQMSGLDAQLAAQNANAYNRVAMMIPRYDMQVKGLNYAGQQAKATAVGTPLENISTALAGMGTENFRMNQINNNPYFYQVIGKDGVPVYVANRSNCGGLLKKYKK